jgi:hypothetical protein
MEIRQHAFKMQELLFSLNMWNEFIGVFFFTSIHIYECRSFKG